MNLGYEYIKYLVKGQGRHQIHSPFVYDFVDVCIKKKIEKNDRLFLNEFIYLLNNNNEEYDFDFYGAGSRNKKTYTKIKDFAEKASSKGKKWKLLYNVTKHYNPKRILELGTNFGLGTLAFRLGSPNSQITTIEGSKTIYSINQKNFEHFNINDLTFINNSFESFLSNIDKIKYDIIFIDGDHKGQALLENLNKLIANSYDNTLIIIDDIRWSKDMYLAWKQIIDDKRFNLTMDLFQLGIIAKMPSKEKEHFIIKY